MKSFSLSMLAALLVSVAAPALAGTSLYIGDAQRFCKTYSERRGPVTNANWVPQCVALAQQQDACHLAGGPRVQPPVPGTPAQEQCYATFMAQLNALPKN